MNYSNEENLLIRDTLRNQKMILHCITKPLFIFGNLFTYLPSLQAERFRLVRNIQKLYRYICTYKNVYMYIHTCRSQGA